MNCCSASAASPACDAPRERNSSRSSARKPPRRSCSSSPADDLNRLCAIASSRLRDCGESFRNPCDSARFRRTLHVCIVTESANRRRVVSGMRPTGKLHLGHLVGALKNWVALQETYRCYYFVADWHALTSHYADTGEIVDSAARQRRRLDRRGPGPRALDAVRAVAGAGARRAGAAARHDHADPVARTGAHLQGADRAARRARPVVVRLSGLSAAADGRRDHVPRQLRAGRRRSGAASRAVAGDRAPVQQLLRRGVSGASGRCSRPCRGCPGSTTGR